MNEPKTVKPSPADSNVVSANVAKRESQSNSTETTSNSEAKPIKELAPDEQMALYEKELKENDWGHQPC